MRCACLHSHGRCKRSLYLEQVRIASPSEENVGAHLLAVYFVWFQATGLAVVAGLRLRWHFRGGGGRAGFRGLKAVVTWGGGGAGPDVPVPLSLAVEVGHHPHELLCCVL